MRDGSKRTKRKALVGSLEELLQRTRVLLKSGGGSPMTAERRQHRRWGGTWTKMVGGRPPGRGE